jgi:hypothetical protein
VSFKGAGLVLHIGNPFVFSAAISPEAD